jgi:tetratricopeptide (TPR) repeat protein
MRLRAAIWLYPYWLNRGTLLEGIRWLDGLRSLASESSRETQAAAANALAILTWKTGDYDRAQRLFEEALVFWEEHGPVTNVAGILNNLGIVAADRGDFSQAQQFYSRSVEIYRQAGPAGLLATSLSNSGVNAMRLNDLPRASELLHQARNLLGTGADWPLLANTMLNLAELYARLGEHNKARKAFAQCMEIRHRLDTHENFHLCWFVLGEIARSERHLPLAVTCWSAAVHAMEGSEEQPSPSTVADLENRLSSARGELNSDAFERATTHGRYLHIDSVISPQGDWLGQSVPRPSLT